MLYFIQLYYVGIFFIFIETILIIQSYQFRRQLNGPLAIQLCYNLEQCNKGLWLGIMSNKLFT